MPETMPNLWGPGLRVDVLTPLAILRAQAILVGKLSAGLLEGIVVTSQTAEAISHSFDIKAPSIGQRVRILRVAHDLSQVYPALISAPCFSYEGSEKNENRFDVASDEVSASFEEDFVRLLKVALNSRETLAVIQSLIARSNENKAANQPAPAVGDASGS